MSTAVIVISTDRFDELESLAEAHRVSIPITGETGGDRFEIVGALGATHRIDLPVEQLRDVYESGLPRALEGVSANA